MNGAGKSVDRTAPINTGLAYTPMRHCTGICKKRRSITQFDGSKTICKQCTKRMTP